MRILNGVLAVVLALLVVANMGDREAVLLVPALAAGAFWTLLAALFPAALAMRPLVVLLSFTAAAVLLGVWYFWPGAEGLVRVETWQQGQIGGFALVALALLGPMMTSIRQEKVRRQKRLAEKEARITERHRSALGRSGTLGA